ncbi:hypothetical protein [Thermoactinospora rubra]|uniref:hypothetical protein n=1 Tax=Thermoactinospora rubra TaxID=1088767 RepID=UPI000A104A08|nr:hypothetical protein [Thermoactinospora rubra]
MPASVPFRLARAAAFAAVCTVLGLLAHRFGGGDVGLPVAAAAFAASWLAAVPAAARERGYPATVALLAVLQAVLHLLFSLAHAAEPTALSGHAHAGLVPGLGMLAAHGWAVALTALWLARGEAALWSLVRRMLVRLSLVWPEPPPVPFYAVPAPEPNIPRPALLRHTVNGRAPPVSPAA